MDYNAHEERIFISSLATQSLGGNQALEQQQQHQDIHPPPQHPILPHLDHHQSLNLQSLSEFCPQPQTQLNNTTFYTCLICNKSLSETCTIFKLDGVLPRSSKKIEALLKSMLPLPATPNHPHSEAICTTCFNLLDKADGLQIELATIRTRLQQDYQNTLRLVGESTTNLPRMSGKSGFDQGWELESAAEDDQESSDGKDGKRKRTVAKGARKAKRTPATTRGRKAAMKKTEEVVGEVRKRGRGRPKKKDKEAEEMIGPDSPTKECPDCRKVVHAKKYLIHLATHRLFPCPFCESVFKRKDIKNHLAEAHQEEIHYPCLECDQVFDTYMQLRSHCLVVHMGVQREQYSCKSCARKFSSLTGLKVHMETIHERKQVFECPECKEIFNQKGNMQNHFRRVHQGEEARKLLCDICGKGFICPSDLRKHVERVHLKVRKNEAICDICSKPFSDTRAMRIHKNAVHTREIKHPCPECKMVFHSLTNMVTHRRRIHGGAEGRRNICEVCGKGFCSPSDLKTHIRVVHDNVRKYVCDICGQAFKVCSHLKYHRRKHTGESPYECPHCGKCFHGPSHISDHVKKVHKTVYIGTNQRRKLNLPDTAPPPPPNLFPQREKPKKQDLTPDYNIPIPHSYAPQNHVPIPQSNPIQIPPPQGMIEQHHSYQQFQFQSVDQGIPSSIPINSNSQQTSVPMVVRLLHDLQY